MRIYTRVIMDMATGRITAADHYEHQGPVALLKGGGGGSYVPPPTPPPEDNSAEIEAAAAEARRLARRRAGRSSTILTAGLGASATPGAPKKLLGA